MHLIDNFANNLLIEKTQSKFKAIPIVIFSSKDSGHLFIFKANIVIKLFGFFYQYSTYLFGLGLRSGTIFC